MKRHIKIFILASIACMIFFTTEFCKAQTVSNSIYSTNEISVHIDNSILQPQYKNLYNLYDELEVLYEQLESIEQKIQVVKSSNLQYYLKYKYLYELQQVEAQLLAQISNVLKSISDTERSIINNIR